MTNRGASSIYTNGNARYRQHLRASEMSLHSLDPAHYEINQNQPEPDENFPEGQTWETSVDDIIEPPVPMEESE